MRIDVGRGVHGKGNPSKEVLGPKGCRGKGEDREWGKTMVEKEET